MKDILILVDDENKFLLSMDDEHKYQSMDIKKLTQNFKKWGFNSTVIKFGEINLDQNFNDVAVLYQSSERQGGFYKSYIEDIIYYLENKGALVLPKFKYLKAHHNKVYMELMRKCFKNNELKTIESFCFGSSDEALAYTPTFPVVLKTAAGAGSYGVKLARNEKEYKKSVRELSRVYIYDSIISMFKDFLKTILMPITKKKRKKKGERKFIAQTFVSNLKGDYKVLHFGGKYYTLYRENRDNDFRASGGGKLFPVPNDENLPLLDFAKKVVEEIDFPILGVDIGYDGHKYHLLEFQMIHLGPYTLQFSDYYFVQDGIGWRKIESKSDLEDEFVRSIVEYIKNID